jgi:hypothetical protein
MGGMYSFVCKIGECDIVVLNVLCCDDPKLAVYHVAAELSKEFSCRRNHRSFEDREKCFLFISVCLTIYIWMIHNDPVALWDMRQPPEKQKDPEYFEVSLS